MRSERKLVAVGLCFALTVGSCKSGTDNSNGGDATDFHQQLQDAVQNNLAGFREAFNRFALVASGGTQQTGVTVTPIANGVQATVGVDVDGDGALETTIGGKLIYLNTSQGLAGGANFTLTGISGGAPQTASGSAVVTQTGPATLTISNGSFTTHTGTRANDFTLSHANLDVDGSGAATTLSVTGTSDFTYNGLAGQLTFLQGYRIQVSGSGFSTFTVP